MNLQRFSLQNRHTVYSKKKDRHSIVQKYNKRNYSHIITTRKTDRDSANVKVTGDKNQKK